MVAPVAVLIGAIASLISLFLTRLFLRRALFWLPIIIAVSLGLIVACAMMFWGR